MRPDDGRWVVILAGGRGRRVGHLTRTPDGTTIPKQYWDLGVGPTLFRRALDRAKSLVPPERILVVVDGRHRRFWQPAVRGFPEDNLVVQRRDHGTAIGVLGPLVRIALREPRARILALPSDHFVQDEGAFAKSLDRALAEAAIEPGHVAVLGITPSGPDPDYGWILPGEPAGRGTFRVEAFVEKPSALLARRLHERGALWSGFVFAARVPALLDLFRRARPGLLRDFLARTRAACRASLAGPDLEGLPVVDFSREVLEPAAGRLRLLRVAPCGWTDLGTPERIRAWREQSAAFVPEFEQAS